MIKQLLIILFVTTSLNTLASIRDESDRFKLLYDRHNIDQDLKGLRKHASYFALDIGASSGLLDIMNDISDATEEDNSSSYEKEANVYRVLTKNLNTEKMIMIDLMTGLPLPFFKIKKVSILPNIFAGISAGAIFTIHNTNDPLEPEAQTYLKLDKKIGVNSKIHWNTQDTLNTRIYHMIRQDMEAATSYSEIAGDGEIAGTDDLSKAFRGYYLDLGYEMNRSRNSYLFELKEFLWYKDPKSTTNGNFGKLPVAHFRYQNQVNTTTLKFAPFVGIHIRDGYDVTDGFYGGINIDFKDDIAIGFTGKMNHDFITFMPRVNFNHFHVSYTLKTAFANPQNEIWVSSIHTLSISAPL